MKECIGPQSFLHYLTPCTYGSPSAGSYIEICLSSTDPTNLERTRFPFLLINDSDPVTRLVGARFRTDSGSTIQNVFLLLQKDNYSIPLNETAPVTNPVIEAWWQKAFDFYSKHNDDSSLIGLSRQRDEEGRLLPFHSLFYCKTKRFYFHPPCPKCGLPLEQCCDDHLLSSLELGTYAGSSRRYLFCSSCISSDAQPHFYAYEAGNLDPPWVKGRSDLIRLFGELVKVKNETSQLPCLECPESRDCFSPENAASFRIVPFSFYPFRLLIFEAMSLSAPDFMALASGATFEQLGAHLKKLGEVGRMHHLESSGIRDRRSDSPYLFQGDHKFFLEVLYLKLSFLGQVVREAVGRLEGSDASYPTISFDRIWIKLTDKSTLLPSYWNYEIKHLDLCREPLEIVTRPKLPPYYVFHQLGVLWFQALLVNARQDAQRMSKALEKAYNRIFAEGAEPSDDLLNLSQNEAAFAPSNVFWNQEGLSLSEPWQSLWDGALALGWSLFRAALQGKAGWSGADFHPQLENLREEIKKELFAPGLEPQPVDRTAEDEAIYGILTKLISKRGKAARKPEEIKKEPGKADVSEATIAFRDVHPEEETLPLAFEPTGEEGPISETVIISPRRPGELPMSLGSPPDEPKPGAEIRRPQAPTPPQAFEPEDTLAQDYHEERREQEDIPETVIISPSRHAAGRAVQAPPPGKARGVEREPHPPLRETGGPGDAPPREAPIEYREEEDISETVIISPRKEQRPPSPAPPQVRSADPPAHQRELYTIHAEAPAEPEDQGQDAPEDDFLSETIILSPGKDKKKK